MKLNHRLLITSGLLLAMSTVAMSTATYAWFTTTRQSQITLSNISIQQDSNLEMEIVSVNGVSNAKSTSGVEYGEKGFGVYDSADTIFTGTAVQDVSGNGVSFFKPNIASDASTFTSTATVSTDTFKQYVNEIVIGFRSDKAYEVYLNKSTAITEINTKLPGADAATDNGLSKSARVAFFNTGSANSAGVSTDTLKGVIVTDLESAGHNYLTGTNATSVEVGHEVADNTHTYNTGYSGFEGDNVPVHNDTIETKTSNSTGLDWYVTKLAVKEIAGGGNEQYTGANGDLIDAYMGYVVIRIWVEGTDADCTGNARHGAFSVQLDFNSYLPA